MDRDIPGGEGEGRGGVTGGGSVKRPVTPTCHGHAPSHLPANYQSAPPPDMVRGCGRGWAGVGGVYGRVEAGVGGVWCSGGRGW